MNRAPLSEADGYEAFALAYDRALGRAFHESIARRLNSLDERFPSPGPDHLDIACGTGLLLEWAVAKGWNPVGVDVAPSMLALARRRHPRLICADMRELPFCGTFDRITCVYDSLNHLLDEEDLVRAFSDVARLMHAGSMFWFDVNHPDAYESVWSDDEPFEASGEGWLLRIDTYYDREHRLGVGSVSGFATLNGAKVEIEEVHHQRPWNDRVVRSALAAAGLRAVWRTRFEPFGPGGEKDGLKVFYAATLR